MDPKLGKIDIDKDVIRLFGVAPLAFTRTQREFKIIPKHLDFLIMFYHLQRSRKPGFAVDHDTIMNYSDGEPNYEMVNDLKNRGWLQVYGVVNGKRFYRITTQGMRIARFFFRNLDNLYATLQ